MKNIISLRLAFILAALVISAFSRDAWRLAAQQPASRSVLSGVYTEERAKRGAALFDEQCAKCHNGGAAVSFTDETFLSTWDGKTVDRLYEVIRKTMPIQKPTAVSDQEKIDILAYIFSLNHFPAGKQELEANPEVLKQIRFEHRPGAAPRPSGTAASVPAGGPRVKPPMRPLAEAAKDAMRTPEEEDALRAADVDTVTPRPHVPATYWIDVMPEDPNKQLVVNRCAFCHDMQRSIAYSRSREQWADVTESMMKRGSPVKPEEFPRVVDYLTKYFGPGSKPRGGTAMQPCSVNDWPKGSADFRKPWGNGYTIWASDQQGDTVDIINPATNKVVRRIRCINGPDRAEFSPDGNIAYIPSRVEFNITVVDTRTGAIKAKVPVRARPNTAILTKDGKELIVAIWPVDAQEGTRGYLQVMDTTTLKIVQTIEERGGMHDVWLAKGGEMFLAMPGSAQHVPTGNRYMNAYDTKSKKLLWTCCTTNYGAIGMMDIEQGPDGKASRAFVSDITYPGFVVHDARTGKELQRVPFPADSDGPCADFKPRSAFHGNEISFDGKFFWMATQDATRPCGNIAYRFSLPDLKPAGHIHMLNVDQTGLPYKAPIEGMWLVIAPDGKTVYVSRAGRNMIAVLDIATMKEVTQIPVGEYPLHINIWPRGTP